MDTTQEKPLKITERVARLEEVITKMVSILENLDSKLNKQPTHTVSGTIPDTSGTIPVDVSPVEVPGPNKTETSYAISSPSSYPIPFDYREIINTVLNSQFGIKVEPLSDRPAFQLQIIVPEKYSNISEGEKQMYKVDVRSKIISYAEGLNGVRQYAELVANNLGPERRAMIITDRANLQ